MAMVSACSFWKSPLGNIRRGIHRPLINIPSLVRKSPSVLEKSDQVSILFCDPKLTSTLSKLVKGHPSSFRNEDVGHDIGVSGSSVCFSYQPSAPSKHNPSITTGTVSSAPEIESPSNAGVKSEER